MTIAYDYGYSAFKRERELGEHSIKFSEIETICKKFKSFRAEIFNLCYVAEKLNSETMAISRDNIDTLESSYRRSILNEFNLIFPVIVKLSETADFITETELHRLKEQGKIQ